MSDLTAFVWAEQMLDKLRDFERTCEDSDLFCVGYLIPQVELLEVAKGHEKANAAQWQQWFEDYVNECLEKDGVSSEDANRIRDIALDASPK
jgi:hypothetical protein